MMKMLTANRLADGVVVYLADGGGWVGEFSRGRILADAQAVDAALAEGEAARLRQEVVDPYLIDLVADSQAGGASVSPKRWRERIRQNGPSITYLPHHAS